MSYVIQFTDEKTKEAVSNDGKRVRTHTRTGIILPEVDVGTHAVKKDCGHLLGEVHYEDYDATLRDIDVARRVTRDVFSAFDIVLVYSTDAAEPDEDTDPCSQRTKRSQGTAEQTIYITQDRSGDVIANAAGTPFAGGIPVSLELPTWVYEKNLPTYDRTRVSQWCNALNENTFNGCDAETLKLKITADERYEGKFHFWAHRFEMAYLPFGWQPAPVNAGLLQVASLAEGLMKPILDPHTRQPVSEPWPLKAAGGAGAGEALDAGYAPGDVNFIDVDFYQVKNFSSLGLEEF